MWNTGVVFLYKPLESGGGFKTDLRVLQPFTSGTALPKRVWILNFLRLSESRQCLCCLFSSLQLLFLSSGLPSSHLPQSLYKYRTREMRGQQLLYFYIPRLLHSTDFTNAGYLISLASICMEDEMCSLTGCEVVLKTKRLKLNCVLFLDLVALKR